MSRISKLVAEQDAAVGVSLASESVGLGANEILVFATLPERIPPSPQELDLMRRFFGDLITAALMEEA